MAAERRAAVDQRFSEVEERQTRLEHRLGGVKRKFDEVYQTTELVLQGTDSVETLYTSSVPEGGAGPDAGGFPKVKREILSLLVKEMTAFLGLTYPLVTEPGDDWSEGKRKVWRALLTWERAATTHALVRNVYARYRRSAEGSWQRIPGTFNVHLRFCLAQLGMHTALVDTLEAQLRWQSGLKAAGKTPAEANVAPGERVLLVYLNKTEAQREKGKSKGKGDKGKGKGKGDSKGKGKGKGKNKSKAAKGADEE